MIVIWIELEHMDRRGQFYRTRLDGPDGRILCHETRFPVVVTCRIILEMGFTGQFETRKPGIRYACMTGWVEKACLLDVEEDPVRWIRARRGSHDRAVAATEAALQGMSQKARVLH